MLQFRGFEIFYKDGRCVIEYLGGNIDRKSEFQSYTDAIQWALDLIDKCLIETGQLPEYKVGGYHPGREDNNA